MEIRLLIDSGNSQLKWVILFRKHPGSDLLATSDRVDVKDVLSKHKHWFLKNLILKSLKNLKKNSSNELTLLQMQEATSVYIASVAPKALNQVIANELAKIFPQQNISFIWTANNHKIINHLANNF